MGRASARVDGDGIVCVLYVCEESAVVEHVHFVLAVEKYPVWIEASRVIVHVVRYLVKARAWRGIGVIVVFLVGLRFLFCFSVALLFFVVDVHN